jgi:hypothetical protein
MCAQGMERARSPKVMAAFGLRKIQGSLATALPRHDELHCHHRRYATINKTSQESPKAVDQIMDTRTSEPGLDTPHTRHCFAPRFTFAPHRLQAKSKIVPPAGRRMRLDILETDQVLSAAIKALPDVSWIDHGRFPRKNVPLPLRPRSKPICGLHKSSAMRKAMLCNGHRMSLLEIAALTRELATANTAAINETKRISTIMQSKIPRMAESEQNWLRTNS